MGPDDQRPTNFGAAEVPARTGMGSDAAPTLEVPSGDPTTDSLAPLHGEVLDLGPGL